MRDLSHQYNHIRSLHQQRDLPSQSFFQEALYSLAQIFVRHRAHHNFAITLLHRHHDLPTGYAMVHSHDSGSEDRCSMEQLGDDPIFPCAFHCCFDNGFDFVPYEYSARATPVPSRPFLSDVASYLHQHGLCEALAISCMTDPGQVWMESLSRDGNGTVAVPSSMEQPAWDKDHIVTEWAVVQDGLRNKVIAIKACNDKEPGHTRS